MCVVSVMKSFIEGLVEVAYFALLYDHLVASVMKLAISVIESAFRLHSDSAILSAVSVMIFVNFGSTNNLFPTQTRAPPHERPPCYLRQSPDSGDGRYIAVYRWLASADSVGWEL